MALPQKRDPLTLQTFKALKDAPEDAPEDPPKDQYLAAQETRICTGTGKRYVFWEDIKRAFVGISYLQDWTEQRALFMIDQHGGL